MFLNGVFMEVMSVMFVVFSIFNVFWLVVMMLLY